MVQAHEGGAVLRGTVDKKERWSEGSLDEAPTWPLLPYPLPPKPSPTPPPIPPPPPPPSLTLLEAVVVVAAVVVAAAAVVVTMAVTVTPPPPSAPPLSPPAAATAAVVLSAGAAAEEKELAAVAEVAVVAAAGAAAEREEKAVAEVAAVTAAVEAAEREVNPEVHHGDVSLQLRACGRKLNGGIWVSGLAGQVTLTITAVPPSGGLLDGPLEWPGYYEKKANAVIRNKKKGTQMQLDARYTAVHIYCTLKFVFKRPTSPAPKPAKPPTPKPAKLPPALLLLSVPEHMPSQAHAQALQAGLMHGFKKLQVVALNGGGAGSWPAGGEAERSGAVIRNKKKGTQMQLDARYTAVHIYCTLKFVFKQPTSPAPKPAKPPTPKPAKLPPALLLLSVLEHVPSQAHAQALQAGLMHGFKKLQVVALNGGGAGSWPAGGEAERSGEATTQEQARAMLQHRLEALQLQRRALDGSSTSLLAQAQLVAAFQPCRYTLMSAGRPHVFGTVYIGLMDLATGRSAVAASASHEVPAAVSSWGRAATELDAESAMLVTKAWRALINRW